MPGAGRAAHFAVTAGTAAWEKGKSVGHPSVEGVYLRRRLRWFRRRTQHKFVDWQRAQVESWDDVPMAKLGRCGRVAWSESVAIHGVQGDDGLTAFPVGVVSCASIWSCPVCSAKIRTRRSLEVQAAAKIHAALGGELVMLTLTLRHVRGQGLAQLLDVLKDSWKAVQQQRGWARGVRRELVGSVTGTEVTFGPNGWHPHLHLLLFLPAGSAAADSIRAWLPAAWQRAVARNLGESAPDLEHGVHVLGLDASAAEYVSKIADETTRADLKGNARSNWAILDGVEDGEAASVAAWVEWYTATKGKRAIVWSRGLKDRFGIDDLSDEEIAERDVDGQVLDVIPSDQWLSWCRSLTPSGIVQALAHIEELERSHGIP